MILAFDSYYFDNKVKTVCIAFEEWTSKEFTNAYFEILDSSIEYKSGSFYERELPCIIDLLSKVDMTDIESIIVDGFVYLDDKNKLGLGGYLFSSLDEKFPVVGVAKSDFISVENNKKTILRGQSKTPLFITSVGMKLEDAAKRIESMYGEFRIPKLLKDLDKLTKS